MKTLFSIVIFICYSSHGSGQLFKEYLDSAKTSKQQNNAEQAIFYYNKAKAALPGDSVVSDFYIQISKSMADLYYSARKYDEALLTCHELTRIVEKLHTEIDPDYAWACNMLGAIYNNYGKFDSARLLHLKAKHIREKLFGNKDRSYAQSCNNLAALYRDIGQFDLAEPLFLEAKAIRQNIEPAGKAPQYAITCVALANLYRDMGQYGKAEMLYLEAKEMRSIAGKENTDYANSCNILADLYYYMKHYEKAETLYLESKDIRQKLDSTSYEYGQSCNNLANLYRDMEQFIKAESLALEAKKIYDKVLPPGHGSLTINMNNLGELYYSIGNYKESEACFLNARNQWQKKLGSEHPYLIANSESLARLYRNMNKADNAAQHYAEASQLKYKQLNKIFRFTSETEKQLYLQNINGSGDEYLSFYYKEIPNNKSGGAYTICLSNRNLILSSVQQTRKIINNSRDTILIKIYNNWTGLKEQLAKLYSLGAGAKIELVKALEEKADSLEKKLARHSVVFKKHQQETGWKDIQLKLRDYDASIEFASFRFNDRKRLTDTVMYVALLLRKNNPFPVLIPLFNETKLVDLLSLADNVAPGNLSNPNHIYKNNSIVSKSIYELVWKPLEKELKGIRTVYFAPSGILHRIAFAALPLNGMEVLRDRYKLVQLASTESVADQEPYSINSSDKIFLYGGISYDADTIILKKAVASYHKNTEQPGFTSPVIINKGNFKYLPGTAKEIDEISRLSQKANIRVAALSGITASEESFKMLNGKYSPSVMHIATHGFFYDPKEDSRDSIRLSFEISGKIFKRSANPLFRSGLLFAGANLAWKGKPVEGIEDGVLTAYEISNMYLPNTKLIVLSACETALGDIHGSEGVYGLQRAFKMAGVKNLVMSLWKVPDTETAEFMLLFYKNLFAKQSIANAFYDAQKTMKDKYRDDPYKWAAWILIK